MLGFKPRISDVGSDRSANCATTTGPNIEQTWISAVKTFNVNLLYGQLRDNSDMSLVFSVEGQLRWFFLGSLARSSFRKHLKQLMATSFCGTAQACNFLAEFPILGIAFDAFESINKIYIVTTNLMSKFP